MVDGSRTGSGYVYYAGFRWGIKGEPGYNATVTDVAMISFFLLWLTGIIYSVVLVMKHNGKARP